MKPGRSTSGGLNLNEALEQRERLERAPGNSPGGQPLLETPAQASSGGYSASGSNGSQNEGEIQAYPDFTGGPKPGIFPPLDALSARLGEFGPPSSNGKGPHATTTDTSAHLSQRGTGEPPRGSDLAWFEERFAELQGLLKRQGEAGKGEIISINTKLAEIIGRVDRLSAAMPGEKTIATVEKQLAELSHSLKETREQNSSDASRIERAAREILAATERAEQARAGFENAASHTVRELGQTVAIAASRAAEVTARQFAPALDRAGDNSRLARVESELQALSAFSRESSGRSEVALERVHETLRVFLEKGPAPQAVHQKRRASVHDPIAGNGSIYSRPDSSFGSQPARKPQIEMITLREPPPSDPNLLRALEEAGEKIAKGSSQAKHGQRQGGSHPGSKPMFREEDKAMPLFWLSVVAATLLIASAGLYYLHARTQIPPFHLSVLPDVQPARYVPNTPLVVPDRQSEDATPDKFLTSTPKGGPALFTAADQSPAASPVQPDSGDDLQILTSAAGRGDKEAQYRIAARFLKTGQGDAAAAARWLVKAASQGHTESQFVLASLYEHGAGVQRDEDQARDLYRRAASAGHVRAMHNLGVMLAAQDTAQEYEEAAGWFSSAAMAGLTDSQFNLALLYERGLGLQQNNQKAYFWYKVAALAGDKEAAQRAEQLKRTLPEADTQAAAERAGSWHPAVEQSPRLAAGSPARG